jgi:outer membrane immunogenic protein
MKRIVLAAAFVALGSASALAADLGAHTYGKAPAMATAATNWSGLYIGGNVGYGWGNNSTDFSFLPTPDEFEVNNASLRARSSGVIGGAQLGYNWQIGSLVTGVEADIQGSGIKGSARGTPIFADRGIPDPNGVLSSEQKLAWFGTVRGRLGVTVTPDLMLYGTGGLAYGRADASANWFQSNGGVQNQAPASVSRTQIGWTAGAGAEWMFARNWSAKLEYLYIDLGSASAIRDVTRNQVLVPPFAVGYTWHARENIARVGLNYHFN